MSSLGRCRKSWPNPTTVPWIKVECVNQWHAAKRKEPVSGIAVADSFVWFLFGDCGGNARDPGATQLLPG
jgi:hypothetical protein